MVCLALECPAGARECLVSRIGRASGAINRAVRAVKCCVSGIKCPAGDLWSGVPAIKCPEPEIERPMVRHWRPRGPKGVSFWDGAG